MRTYSTLCVLMLTVLMMMLAGGEAAHADTCIRTSGLSTVDTRDRLIVTPKAGQWKYGGGADPELTYTFTGAIAGETPAFTGALSREGGEAGGTYAITRGTLALVDNGAFLAANYKLVFTEGVTFDIIIKDVSAATIADINNITYNGAAHTPEPEVRFGGVLLTKDTDYTLAYANNINAGTATVTVIGQGEYIGTQEKTFKINAKSVYYLTIADIADVTYNGKAHTPEPEVKDGDTALVKDTDYTLAYFGNINATGDPYVTVTGQGNYIGTVNKYFYINRANLTVTPDAGQGKVFGEADPVPLTYTFTGAVDGETPAFTGALSRKPGENASISEYSYPITQGTLALVDNGAFKANNYNLVVIHGRFFTITRKGVSALTIADLAPVTYNGAAHTPEPVVKDGDTPLVKDTDYTLSYFDNTSAGTAEVRVFGKGNYQGWEDKTFTINKATVTVTPDAGQNKVFGGADPVPLTYTFTGAAAGQTAGFTGKLSRTVGETVGTYAIDQGTLALANNGAFKVANYTLAFTDGVTFAITSKSVDGLAIADIAAVTYNGAAHTPEPEVKDGDTPLVKDTDYTLAYANNTNAGNATVTVTCQGNYSGTRDKTFTINKATVTVTPDADQTKVFGGADPVPLTYTVAGVAAGQTAGFTGKLSRTAGEAVGTYPINQDTLTLADNGAFQVSNYTLAFTDGVTFAITSKSVDGLAIADIAPVTYNGAAQTPEPEVKDGDTPLVKDTDYTLAYANNTNVGIATVTVNGKGNYSGTRDKTFTINKATVTVTPDAGQTKVFGGAEPAELTYTVAGVAAGQTAGFTGKLSRVAGEAVGAYPITQGTLTLADNGAFKVANYTLAFTAGVTFAITAKDGPLTIADIAAVTYNGAAHTPEPIVKDGDKELVKGVDYTLAYENNINAGVATVTVTGQGGYAGTQAKTFTINKAVATVTPDAGQTKVFGGADPAELTYTVVGVAAGQTAGFTGKLSRVVGEAVGTYPITQGTLALADNGAFKVANYTLAFTAGVTFAITAKDGLLTIADIAPVTYNGAAHTPEPIVKDGDKELVKGVDYTLAYENNINAGVATVTVTGQGDYAGTQAKTFTINKAVVTVTPDAGQTKVFGADDPELTYTVAGVAAGQTAGFTGKLSRVAGEAVGTYLITQGTLALADNGAFKVANYTLAFTAGVTFAITAKDRPLTIADIAPVTYNGAAHTPEPIVKDGDKVLVKGVDYTLAYANNTNAGIGIVIVTGLGNYTGMQAITFTINKATAAITWPAPAPIITGMKLSDAQLNAVADIPGAFAYDPPAGTALPAGEHTLTVVFTPEDAGNWTPTTAEVRLSVVAGTVMWLIADLGNDEAPIALAFGETETAALAEDAFDVAANPGQRASLCSASGERHLSRDFRPFPGENGVTRWRLAIAASGRRGGAAQPQNNRGEDHDVTLGWDISAAAQDRQLYLQQIVDEQPVGHAIDMRVTASAAVNSGSVYEIAYAPITEARVNVTLGWNFIGCSVMATESEKEQLERFIGTAGGPEVLWHWKNGRYKIWPEDEPLRPEAGYFFYSYDAGGTVSIKGIKADGTMLLQPGWNFISLPDGCLLPAVEGMVSRAWRLQGNAYQSVVSGEALAAGSNYWIFVNSGKPVLVNFGN